MSTEISNPQKIIYMKSKLPIFIDQDRAENLEKILEMNSGHRFIKVGGEGTVINTAEIEGIYTPAQYDELQKVKEGYRKCVNGVWHGRKEECSCAKEIARKAHEEKEKLEAMKDRAYSLISSGKLKGKPLEVLKCRFGYSDGKIKDVAQTAEVMKLTEEKIREHLATATGVLHEWEKEKNKLSPEQAEANRKFMEKFRGGRSTEEVVEPAEDIISNQEIEDEQEISSLEEAAEGAEEEEEAD